MAQIASDSKASAATAENLIYGDAVMDGNNSYYFYVHEGHLKYLRGDAFENTGSVHEPNNVLFKTNPVSTSSPHIAAVIRSAGPKNRVHVFYVNEKGNLAEIYTNISDGPNYVWSLGTLQDSEIDVNSSKPLTATGMDNTMKVWFARPKGDIRLAFTKPDDSASWTVKQPFNSL